MLIYFKSDQAYPKAAVKYRFVWEAFILLNLLVPASDVITEAHMRCSENMMHLLVCLLIRPLLADLVELLFSLTGWRSVVLKATFKSQCCVCGWLMILGSVCLWSQIITPHRQQLSYHITKNYTLWTQSCFWTIWIFEMTNYLSMVHINCLGKNVVFFNLKFLKFNFKMLSQFKNYFLNIIIFLVFLMNTREIILH